MPHITPTGLTACDDTARPLCPLPAFEALLAFDRYPQGAGTCIPCWEAVELLATGSAAR